ncbi:MAG: ferrous iron transport protein B [Armatimonadetes bacterium]|nr:ferrous iron transport protein B [Armatimonadota bacterium]
MQTPTTETAREEATRRLVLVGNPNVGKSVIFGHLTGQYVTVSNYPGTTVEITRGTATLNRQRSHLIDTPGVNNLLPMSEDERVTRDILLNERVDAIIQVADTKNLRRALLISLQLAEMELPFVLDLNMADEARSRGIAVSYARLAEILGIEAIPTVATQGKGLEALKQCAARPRKSSFRMRYTPDIETAAGEIEALLPQTPIARRSLALMLLAGDESLNDWLYDHLSEDCIEKIEAIRQESQTRYSESLSFIINRQRMEAVEKILQAVMTRSDPALSSWNARLGLLSMHPVWGIPVLLAVLYAIFQFVGVFGAGTAVDFLENTLFNGYINPWITGLVNHVPIPFFRDLLVGEYGLITMALTYAVALVLPIVGTFFIAFGILEDSGYLPRLAVMVDRIFKWMGLNGKAVLPMVLGLGCDTMATLTTRILDSKKDRLIVTLLLSLGVPCSAQLGVILGMLGGMSGAALAIWLSIVLGVLLLVGFLASKVLPGSTSDFVMELPPIRMPQMRNILIKTLARIEWYIREAVPLFFVGTLFLFALDKTGLLPVIERMASPLVVRVLGLPPETTQTFLIGFLRRDYGAAGLFDLAKKGMMTNNQILVSLVTITLFVPCIAQFLVTIKERGLKAATSMMLFVIAFALVVGGLLNWGLGYFGVRL